MYQVLVYVYENYGGGADTPDRQRLGMRLSSAGFERDEIQQALQQCDGNVSAAARLLGMHRRSLQRKLAKRPGPERRWVDE